MIDLDPKVEGHFEVYRALGSYVEENPYLIPFFNELWRAARTHFVPELPPFTPTAIGSAEDVEKIDVLFMPVMGRSHFIGPCIVVAEALHYLSSQVKIAFLKNDENTIPDEFLDYVEVLDVQKISKLENNFCGQDPVIVANNIKNKISNNDTIIPWVNLNEFSERLERTFIEIDICRSFLRRRKVQYIVTANEMLPVSMTMLAAARLEKITFVQNLHGCPHRFYAPFLSNETWVWGERAQQAFMDYGVEKDRLPIIGALELSHLKLNAQPAQQSVELKGTKTLVCCLQNIFRSRFMKPLLLIKEAFEQLPNDWNLKLRIYPGHNNDETISLINEWFGAYEGRVGYTCNTPLLDDFADADIVCTGSSTAVVMAMGLGYKSVVLWNNEFDAYIGTPIFDKRRICYTSEELVEKVLNPLLIPDVQESEIAHQNDAPYMAAARIMNHLLQASPRT